MGVAAPFGPFKPAPAHPGQSLRDVNEIRTRERIVKRGLPIPYSQIT